MRTLNDQILNLSAVTADARSEAIDLTNIYGYSCQVVWTSSTAAGTIKLEVSNDGATWTELTSPTQAILNNNGSVMFNVADCFYQQVRVLVDYTSGTIATVTAQFNAKGI